MASKWIEKRVFGLALGRDKGRWRVLCDLCAGHTCTQDSNKLLEKADK